MRVEENKVLLYLDLETLSSVNLLDCGAYAYAESEDFEILLLAYAFGEEDVTVVDLKLGEKIPLRVSEALFDTSVIKSAFNANFERVCLGKWFQRTMPPEQWSCTAVMARSLGLPGSLERCGEVLCLEENHKKMKNGKDLIRFFCSPTSKNQKLEWNLPQKNMEKWNEFKDYNSRDVEAERSIRKKLSQYPATESEVELWVLDQKINDRGVKIDLTLAEQASRLDSELEGRLLEEAQLLTGLPNPKSQKQLKEWIFQETGQEVSSLSKENLPKLTKKIDSLNVLRTLAIYTALNKTSVEKYNTMLKVTSRKDHRARGVLQFYGASRTGRWAGRLIQVQNLPRNKMSDGSLNCARWLLEQGEFPSFELIFDNVADTLSQLVRTAIIPKEGHRFIVADFSAIEARVIAWLSGERWRQEVFATHGKIYEASAEQMFGLPKGSVKKGDPMRDRGKVAELALGYGGSQGALINMDALEMGLELSELGSLVNRWRNANVNITNFWRACDQGAKKVVCEKTVARLPLGVTFYRSGSLLRCRLPSGRDLSYCFPKVQQGTLSYMGEQTKKWCEIESYGAKLVENIVQGVARDCLAVAMLRLEEAGYSIVFHVHDEVILEMPHGIGSVEEVCEIMGEKIPWAEGLILKAAGYECEYYRKD